MNASFHFKQFSIKQNHCAMKVGTDGVLLGAWASVTNKLQSILDIGSGTGLIALQLAQRSFAETIDAVEINPDAFEQCVFNFEESPWADRLFCYHASIQQFTEEIDESYDLIITNPPFFSETPASKNKDRDTARFNKNLPFKTLLQCVSKLLSPKGIFSIIIPKKEENSFIELASKVGLFPNRICRVRGQINTPIKRSLLEFSFQKNKTIIEELTIEISRHNYTKEYTQLVQDFYLKM